MATLPSNDDDIVRYTYRPLPPGVFRLFRFAKAVDDSPLLAECIDTPFDNPVPYEALSYCWAGHERSLTLEERERRSKLDRQVLVVSDIVGTPDTSGQNVLGFIPISAPLEEALRTLCLHTAEPLFVDQLCINQEDKAEKSHLVRRMGDIYASAQRVLAWLGPMTPGAEAFSEFVRRQEELGPAAYHRLNSYDDPAFNLIREAVVTPSRPGLDHLREDCTMLRESVIELKQTDDFAPLRGFVDVFSRAFFGRMWIVQEACLPARVHFVCGRATWDIAAIERARRYFMLFLSHGTENMTAADLERDYPKVDDYIFAIVLCRFVNRLFTIRRTLHRAGMERKPLFHLLINFNVVDAASKPLEGRDVRKFRAGDPRDCYYALLALPSPEDAAVRRVVVNYDRSTQEVFTDLAEALVESHPDVLLLSQHDDCPDRLPDLPSWVPDWSSELKLPHGYVFSSQPIFAAGMPLNGDEDAWPGTAAPHREGRTLVIPGRRLGTAIQRVGEYVYSAVASASDFDAEVSQVPFLYEIELFCKLALAGQVQAPTTEPLTPSSLNASSSPLSSSPPPSPPILPSTPWLLATGGRGLTFVTISNPPPPSASASDLLLGPTLPTGTPLLGAAYALHLATFSHRLRTLERFRWRTRAVSVLEPLENKWRAFRARGRVYRAVVHMLASLGVMRDEQCEAWEFVEKFHRHHDAHHGQGSDGHGHGDDHGRGGKDGGDQGLLASLDDVSREQAEAMQGQLGRAMDVQVNRRCFVTPEGFVGLGPRGMQAGDVVAILKGMSTPVILRPVEGQGQEAFRYVGEAYCYGVMDGSWTAGPPREFRII
ncbi:hypothetical protein VTJ49DRAFT_2533 [Mycothermus thermophilus]|uniref:Heterokaryon incompatibility domain-containing protein n=1 Tax=Humicola insolens TaxID=85995 RepID=A0ABR3V9T9_HUMIN